jgi:hypothetical protein
LCYQEQKVSLNNQAAWLLKTFICLTACYEYIKTWMCWSKPLKGWWIENQFAGSGALSTWFILSSPTEFQQTFNSKDESWEENAFYSIKQGSDRSIWQHWKDQDKLCANSMIFEGLIHVHIYIDEMDNK